MKNLKLLRISICFPLFLLAIGSLVVFFGLAGITTEGFNKYIGGSKD